MMAGGRPGIQAEGLAHISPAATPWVKVSVLSMQATGLLHNAARRQSRMDWASVVPRLPGPMSRAFSSPNEIGGLYPGRCPWAGMNDAVGVRRGLRFSEQDNHSCLNHLK